MICACSLLHHRQTCCGCWGHRGLGYSWVVVVRLAVHRELSVHFLFFLRGWPPFFNYCSHFLPVLTRLNSLLPTLEFIFKHIVWWLRNYRDLSISRWSYICDIDLKRGLISQYQGSDCARGLISRRNIMNPEPNVCTVRRSCLTISLWPWQSVLRRILTLQEKTRPLKIVARR